MYIRVFFFALKSILHLCHIMVSYLTFVTHGGMLLQYSCHVVRSNN